MKSLNILISYRVYVPFKTSNDIDISFQKSCRSLFLSFNQNENKFTHSSSSHDTLNEVNIF